MHNPCFIRVLVACASLALCGCGSAGGREVAAVQEMVISRAALAHWTQIKRLEPQPSRTTRGADDPQRRALVFLITADWLQGEARAQGISVSPTETQTTYRELLAGPVGRSFALSLARHRISAADELLLLRLGQLSNQLQAKISSGRLGGAGARSVDAFVAAFRRRWRQRTSCAPGYVVAECRNGPSLPPG